MLFHSRTLVQTMKVNLPPGCFGIDTDQGSHYADRARADKSPRPIGSTRLRRDRSVNVTDQHDLDLIAQSPYLGKVGYQFSGDGWTCACRHGNWSWSQTCGQCGATRSDRDHGDSQQ